MPIRSRRAVTGAAVLASSLSLFLGLAQQPFAAATPQRTADANGTWKAFGDPTPGPLAAMPCVYDPIRNRAILLGNAVTGAPSTGTFVLSLDAGGTHWTRIPGTGGPGGGGGQNLVYDSARDRALLFTGQDVWALSLTAPMTWTKLAPSGSIPPRSEAIAIYDPVRDRLLVFGGNKVSFYDNDLWQLSLAGTPTWTQLAPLGPLPLGRVRAVGVYDSLHDRLIVFGGGGDTGQNIVLQNDAWALSLAGTPTWAPLSPTGTPPAPVQNAAGIYDPVGDRLLVFGGDGNPLTLVGSTNALSLGASPAWTDLAPAGPPPSPRTRSVFLYGLATAGGLLLGGSDHDGSLPDVWKLVLAPSPAWSKVGDLMGPGPIQYSAGVYDPLHKRFVFFGGTNGSGIGLNTLWSLPVTPGGSWSRLGLDSPARPFGRYDEVFALDTARDRLLVYSGWGTDDTWAFDNASDTWTKLAPTGTPPSARSGSSGFYDAGRDRLVIFGGLEDGGPLLNDTWALEFQPAPHWSQLLPAGTLPAARMRTSVAYDAARDRMLVFGGGGDLGGGSNDLWQLGFGGTPAWTLLTPFGEIPSGRQAAGAIVDPVRQRLVVFGGRTGDGSTYSSDTFTLGLVSDPAGWTLLAPVYDVPGPSARGFSAVAYDALNDRLLVYGGRGIDSNDFIHGHTLDGAFALTWGEPATPALLSFAEERTDPGSVRLTWFTPAGAGQAATAYRSADGATWQAVAQLVSDASGRFVLEDLAPGGGRFDYRLGVTGPDGEEVTADHWVTIPAGAAFGITSTGPNPTRGALTVSLALATGGPATLELFDLAGRRVLRRDLPAGGTGARIVELAHGRDLVPGVYLLRLQQGEQRALRKVAVIR